MNKQAFLAQLKAKLTGLPQDDREERIGFYSEMIDDRVDDGLTEEQAIVQLGTLEDIAAQIMSEIPLTKLVRERVKPSRMLRAWEIVLLALGSPIWLSLLIALLAIVLSVYAVIWSAIVSLWAIEVSLAACSAGEAIASVVFMAGGNITPGVAMLGAGLFSAGLTIFGFFGCKYASDGFLRFSKKAMIGIKSRFMKKEAAE